MVEICLIYACPCLVVCVCQVDIPLCRAVQIHRHRVIVARYVLDPRYRHTKGGKDGFYILPAFDHLGYFRHRFARCYSRAGRLIESLHPLLL